MLRTMLSGKSRTRCQIVGALVFTVTTMSLVIFGLQTHLWRKRSLFKYENASSFVNYAYTQLPVAHYQLPAGKEVRHIGFLKVHKAASSTMQNMFFRFGLKRNLTFVFTKHPNYFSRSVKTHLPLVEPKHRESYDILCNHGMFNLDVYSSVLPKDSVYLAIVRDPLAVFISAVNYYSQPSQLLNYLRKVPGNKLHSLIQHPQQYDRPFFSYTKNVMARDFGFPETTDESRITSYLQKLDSIFKLVIIVEYFEESLILMKHYLKWNLKDILFLSNNVYGKGGSVQDLSPSDIRVFRKRNSLDYSVYDFFYKKFWRLLESQSDVIYDEIFHFRSVLTLLQTFCSSSNLSNNSTLEITKSTWNDQFFIYKNDCDLMKMDELEFIKILRQKQGSEL
ncbi:Galactose-3-O-sulfotransferase 3 [Mactra antiquata]